MSDKTSERARVLRLARPGPRPAAPADAAGAALLALEARNVSRVWVYSRARRRWVALERRLKGA